MTWQPAAVLYPDVELLLTTWLRANLSGSTYTDRRMPNQRQDRMVVVNRDGGAIGEGRDRPRVRIRCWETDDQAAIDLAREVVQKMPLLADGDPVLRVEHLSGPYEVADESEQVQMYLLYELHTRGETP